MTTTALLRPNSELVALAWLGQIDGITPGMVGTTLPRDVMTWTANGFAQVATLGGSPHAYLPVASPVLEVNCWAVTASQSAPSAPVNVSNKPPWGRAQRLVETIRAGLYALTLDGYGRGRWLTMPVPGYAHASVQSAVMLTEARRIPDDQGSYARYSFDLQLTWIPEAL